MRRLMLALVALSATLGAARAGEDAHTWYIEMKRAAKYARISASSTADLARLDREEQAAKRQLSKVPDLTLSTEGRAICQGAAQAVVDFIKAAKAGNMTNGPASFDMQKARWDRLGEECIQSIHRFNRNR